MDLPNKRNHEFPAEPTPASVRKTKGNVALLRQRTGCAPLAVLYCKSCIKPTLADADDIRPGEQYDWALVLVCPACRTSWTVCAKCNNLRNPMMSSAAIYMHHYKKHRSSPSSNYATAEINNSTTTTVPVVSTKRDSNPTLDNNEDDDSFVNIDYHFDTDHRIIPTFTFSADYNKIYFEMEHKHRLGQAYLVGRSQFQLGIVGGDLCSEEVQMHMNIAGLVSAMTTGQREKLATVLDQVVTVTRRQCLSKPSSNWSTQVPVTSSELRAKYVKGKHALLPNLPRPPVQRIGDHAYVSLIDCVADLLGHGLPVDSIGRNVGNSTVSKVSESLKAQHIRDNTEKMSHDESANLLVLYMSPSGATGLSRRSQLRETEVRVGLSQSQLLHLPTRFTH